MSDAVAPLRVGIAVADPLADKYAADLLRYCLARPGELAPVLIVCARPAAARGGRLRRWLWRAILWEERKYLRHHALHRDHEALTDLAALAPRTVALALQWGPQGPALRAADLAALQAAQLDLIVQLEGADLGAALQPCARLGALDFGTAGTGGAPLGFWETYRRQAKTGFALRQAGAPGQDGAVLLCGYYATRARYLLNQADLRYKAQFHLKHFLTQTARLGHLPAAAGAAAPRASRQPLSAARLALYLGKLLLRKLHDKCYKEYLQRTEVWGVSFLAGSWRALPGAQRITPPVPSGHFWADPFLWQQDGRTFCFLEDYAYERALGHIAVLEWREQQWQELGPCLIEPFHLSFPFLFSYQGQLYMCPETSQSGQIRVYRCSEFPLRWELAHVLMEGVSAADTMLFERDGRWWMLTNIDLAQGGDHCSELQLFSAPSPLSPVWEPHPHNPIAIDSEGGRNGGLIIDNGKIFRVGQRQGYCNYGEGAIVYEVQRLSASDYAEVEVQRLDPGFAAGISGTHHINSSGGWTVFDHKSWRKP